jgi:hypothetical protein
LEKIVHILADDYRGFTSAHAPLLSVCYAIFFNLAYSQEYIRTSQMEKALRLCQETDIYMTNFTTAMAKVTDFFEYMDHAGTVFAHSHALNDAIHMWETVRKRNAYMYGH